MKRRGDPRTYNIIKIGICVVLVISCIIYNYIHPYKREYTLKEGLNKLAGQMSIESADTEYYDDDASDTTTESKYSIAYFSEASYEYLDQLTYQQTGVVLEQVRKYLTDNIKEDIEEMNIDGDTFILNDEQCSFDVNLGNNQVIEVMLNRNEYKVEISSKSH